MWSVRSQAIILFVSAVIGAPGAGASPPSRPEPLAVVPIDLIDGYVRLRLRVNDADDLHFIFDTGATRTAIDTGTAARLELPTTERTRDDGQGPFEERIVAETTVTLGGLELAGIDLLLSSEDQLAHTLGIDIDGVIGADLLRDHVVEIDHQRGWLTVHDAASYVHTGAGRRTDIDANAFFATIDGTLVLSDAQVLTGRFLIDTGAGFTVGLNTPFVDDNDLLERLEAPEIIYTLSAHEVRMTSRPARAPRFDLGGFGFDDLPVLLSRAEAGPLSPRAISGIIGNRIWRRFHVVFDYGRDRIYLEPNDEFAAPFQVDCSGLSLRATVGGSLVVAGVRRGSPAFAADIRPGDGILRIDGRESRDLPLPEVRRLLSRDQAAVELAVTRDGQEIACRMILSRQY